LLLAITFQTGYKENRKTHTVTVNGSLNRKTAKKQEIENKVVTKYLYNNGRKCEKNRTRVVNSYRV
jgi:hypothetical protein